jgi:hypothetical protein
MLINFLKFTVNKMEISYEDQTETVEIAGFIAKTYEILSVLIPFI